MLDRLEEILTGGGEFVRAESSMLLTRLRRSVFWGVVAVFGGCAVLLGVVSLLIAVAGMLAQQTGWIAALAIVAGAGLIGGAGVVTAALSKIKSTTAREAMPASERRRSSQSQAKVKGQQSGDLLMSVDQPAAYPSESQARSQAREASSATGQLQERIAEAVTNNPMVAASGAFALLTILGPGRSIKMLGRGMMLASLAASVIKQSGSDNETAGNTNHARPSSGGITTLPNAP